MPEMDLLTVYALAVKEFLDAKDAYLGHRDQRTKDRMVRAEREVRELTTLHLLPPIPDVLPFTMGGRS
jgi:hypothetical protein